MSELNDAPVMEISEIQQLLPHRYPFALVDRVLSFTPGETLTAIKNVTVNEPFFQGHFPGRPVMPGVLIMEALAQTAGILAFKTQGVAGESQDHLFYLTGIDKARFKQVVTPGDQLVMEVQLTKQRQQLWVFSGKARVNGKVAAQGDIMVSVIAGNDK